MDPARPAGSAAPKTRPPLPLAATVLFLLAPLPAGDATASGKVGPADAASLLLVLACAVQALRGRVRPLNPLGVLVLGTPAAGLAVATMTAGDPYAALPGFVRYLQVFVLVPAAVVLLVRDAGEFRLAAGCFVVLALVQGAVGVVQYATHTGASYQGEDVRAVGTFGPGDVMGMATVVAYGLIVATAAGLAPGLPRRLRRIAAGCALALVLPLVLSFSRGAWIATFGAAVLVMALAGIERALKVVAALAAAGVVLVGGFGVGSEMVAERLTSITQVSSAPDQSVTDRYTMWAAAESMWRERPAVGVGLKGFPAHRDGHASLGLSSGSDTAGRGAGVPAPAAALPAQHVPADPERAGPDRAARARGRLGGPAGRGAAQARLRRRSQGLRADRDRAVRVAADRLPLRGHRGAVHRADRSDHWPGGLVGAALPRDCRSRGRRRCGSPARDGRGVRRRRRCGFTG